MSKPTTPPASASAAPTSCTPPALASTVQSLNPSKPPPTSRDQPPPPRWQDARVPKQRRLAELIPNEALLDELIGRLCLTRVSTCEFAPDTTVYAEDSVESGATSTESSPSGDCHQMNQQEQAVIQNLVQDGTYYRASGSFLRLLFLQAASQEWIPDRRKDSIVADLIERLSGNGQGPSDSPQDRVKIETSTTPEGVRIHTWYLRQENTDWTQVLPPSPDLSKESWVEAWCALVNHVLGLVVDLAKASNTDQGATHRQSHWLNAAERVRFHAWGAKPLQTRREEHEDTPQPAIDGPTPDFLIGLKTDIERIVQAGVAYFDDCFLGEARLSAAPAEVSHARASTLFKMASLKDHTPGTGDVWSLVIAGQKMSLFWANAGVVVECDAAVDTSTDPQHFVLLLILFASKAFTLGYYGRHPMLTSHPPDRNSSLNDIRTKLEALSVSETPNNDCPSRLGFRKGARIPLWSQDRFTSPAHPAKPSFEPATSLASVAALPSASASDAASSPVPASSYRPGHLLVIEEDLTESHIRCRSGLRSPFHLTCKSTDVTALRAHVLPGTGLLVAAPSSTAGSRNVVVKLFFSHRNRLGSEDINLKRIQEAGVDKTMLERLPTVLASGVPDLDCWDPFGRLIASLREWHEQRQADAKSVLQLSVSSELLELFHQHRLPYVIVYKRETYELRDLAPRHYFSVVSDAVIGLTCLWHKLGFMHHDISEGNIASRYDGKTLSRPKFDKVIYAMMRDRRSWLQQAARMSETPRWWDKCVQQRSGGSDGGPLCTIADLENAAFLGDPTDDKHEANLVKRGTMQYWSRVDWDIYNEGIVEIPRCVAEDVESLLFVAVALSTGTRQEELGRPTELRGDWRRRSYSDVQRMTKAGRRNLTEELPKDYMLGPDHPGTLPLSQWFTAHIHFRWQRQGWSPARPEVADSKPEDGKEASEWNDEELFKEDIEIVSTQETSSIPKTPTAQDVLPTLALKPDISRLKHREAMYADPKIQGLLYKLLLNAALLSTTLAVSAYERETNFGKRKIKRKD